MIFLQIPSSDGFFYFLGVLILLLISIFLTRWIFRIDTMVHYQKTSTDLLIKIAKYNNVPTEEIFEVLGLTPPNNGEINKTEKDELENNVCILIKDSGVDVATNYVVNISGKQPGEARRYVYELIEKKNIMPKS